MKILMKSLLAAVTLLSTALPQSALAADPKLEGKYSDWTAYSRAESGDKICYVLTSPKSKSPGNVNHGDIYFMVANWKSGAAKEQPSFLAGFPIKNVPPPKARIGSKSYEMYVSQNEAFVESRTDERNLVKAMRAGATMRVQAVSQRGTSVSYEFSLKGVTAALAKAKSACT